MSKNFFTDVEMRNRVSKKSCKCQRNLLLIRDTQLHAFLVQTISESELLN